MKSALTLLLYLTALPGPIVQKDWERVRSAAETQHEMIMMLIGDKKYDEAVESCKKLFALKFPVEQENRLVDSARGICDAFQHNSRNDMAHRILDMALTKVRSNRSKSVLHKEKAYLYDKEGNKKEAMRHFKEAWKLDNSDN